MPIYTKPIGRGIRWMGDYLPSIRYQIGDIVVYEWSSYIANNVTLNNLPTDENYWDLWAIGKKGDKGDQWEQGEQGEKGDKGDTWEDGKTITTITSYKVWKTTTVTINWDYINSPQSFEIEDWDWIGDMLSTNNLSDLENKQTARDNLDVYSKTEIDLIETDINNTIDLVEAVSEANKQAIANLQSASGEYWHSTPIVLTTAEQTVPFDVLAQSSNTDVFELNDVANTVSIKKNAPHNLSTNINFLHNTTQSRTITIRGKRLSDDNIVYTRTITVEAGNNQTTNATSSTLLTIGKNGYPDSPFDLYFTIQCSGTGITINSYDTIISVGSSYDVDVTASWGNISWDINNQTDLIDKFVEKDKLNIVEVKLDEDVIKWDFINYNTYSFPAPWTNISWLAFDWTNLISCDRNEDKIYIHDWISPNILSSFNSPWTNISWLAFDWTNLISCDTSSKKVYIHNWISSNILSNFDHDYDNWPPTWLTFDWTDLISCDRNGVYIHYWVSSSIKKTLWTIGGINISWLAFDWTNLINCNSNWDKIYIYNWLSDDSYSSFSSPSYSPSWLTFDWNNLISCDDGSDKIYVHNLVSSSLNRIIWKASGWIIWVAMEDWNKWDTISIQVSGIIEMSGLDKWEKYSLSSSVPWTITRGNSTLVWKALSPTELLLNTGWF